MSSDPRSPRLQRPFIIPVFLALGLGVLAVGCGSTEEGTEGWETPPPATPTSAIENKVDSLKNENRMMRERLDALAAENRTLNARNAELETKLNEATAAPKVAAPAPVTDVSGAYNAALEQFRKRNFQEAAQQFDAILASGGGKLETNCHYWLGESFYGMKKYGDAIKQFETVLAVPSSSKRPYAQLMIGNAYHAQGDKAAAREAYEKVVSTYPSSGMAEKAKEKLEKMK